jgi:hypothetical protein
MVPVDASRGVAPGQRTPYRWRDNAAEFSSVGICQKAIWEIISICLEYRFRDFFCILAWRTRKVPDTSAANGDI